MIKHIVCWKLINRTEPIEDNPDALAIREALHGLRGKIPGMSRPARPCGPGPASDG